jgi:phosphoribosylformylglycinamidine synthase
LKWKIEVFYKSETPDAAGTGILQDVGDLGIDGVESVRTAQVYWIEGELNIQEINSVCSELLADSVTQEYGIFSESDSDAKAAFSHTHASTIEVRFKQGVTDAVGDSVVKGIRDLGILGIQAVQTGQKYWVQGSLSRSNLETIAQRLLANEVIQTFSIQDVGG